MVVVLPMTARTLSMAIVSLCLETSQKLLANCNLFLIMQKPFWVETISMTGLYWRHCTVDQKAFIVGYQLYDMGVTAVVI